MKKQKDSSCGDLPEKARAGELLAAAPRSSLSRSTPPEVTTAREILLAATPEAAVMLREGVLGSASKEQIAASKAVLAFQGIREDAPASATPRELSQAAAGAAFGAVSALFQRLGIEPPRLRHGLDGASDARVTSGAPSGHNGKRKKPKSDPVAPDMGFLETESVK